jgi:hypothetical protein
MHLPSKPAVGRPDVPTPCGVGDTPLAPEKFHLLGKLLADPALQTICIKRPEELLLLLSAMARASRELPRIP